ncbi:hypothetical protein L208DRAFT_1332293, partial [Tricholoma matsutake]
GLQLIGSLLNYALYGVLCVQVYIYYISFPKDKLGAKSLVFGVFILETLQVCLSAADIYYWFGSGYGNMNHLAATYLSPFDTPLIGSLTSFIIQLFFCYRIWALRNDFWPLCILIGSISTTQLYGGIAGGIRDAYVRYFLSHQAALLHVFQLWLIGNAVADFLIAVTMVFLLMKARRREYRFTNDVIMRLVRLIVETNSLTAGIALFSVILFVVFPVCIFSHDVTLVIGKLYSNTLLVTFNNRVYIIDRHGHSRNLSAVDTRSGSSNSQPKSITLSTSRSYGKESIRLETFNGDRDIEMNIGPQTV